MEKGSSGADQTPSFVAAVVQVDRDKFSSTFGEVRNLTPHLVSVNEKLVDLVRGTLDADPHSPLGKYISSMIHRDVLFEMIGPWPPKHNPNPIYTSPVVCPHCGKTIP